jgi:predicted lactoylglutathione lyase
MTPPGSSWISGRRDDAAGRHALNGTRIGDDEAGSGRFEDLDGHIGEVLWMDPNAVQE